MIRRPPRSTLFLHDALPISGTRETHRESAVPPPGRQRAARIRVSGFQPLWQDLRREFETRWPARSEEHTSELQSQFHLVCRLLLEKKKSTNIQTGAT